MQLCEVAIEVDLDSKDAWNSLEFDITAIMQLEQTRLTLIGAFSTKGDFSMTATACNFDWAAVKSLYHPFFGENLSDPDFDFHIEYLAISISREDGLQIVVSGLQVGQYAAGDGFISF